VDFIIPGNDDAIRAIRLISSKIAEACLEGKQIREARLTSPEGGAPAEETAGKPGESVKRPAAEEAKETETEEGE
jgi:small subunit ribosomal protein S2